MLLYNNLPFLTWQSVGRQILNQDITIDVSTFRILRIRESFIDDNGI